MYREIERERERERERSYMHIHAFDMLIILSNIDSNTFSTQTFRGERRLRGPSSYLLTSVFSYSVLFIVLSFSFGLRYGY